MTPAKQQEIFNLAPTLFRFKDDPRYCHNIECDDGWFDLIKNSILSLEKEAVKLAAQTCVEEYKPVCIDIKSKQGGLRMLIYPVNEIMDKTIKHANSLSLTICEKCGKEGNVFNHKMWEKALCEGCK